MKILISVGKYASPDNYIRAVEQAGGEACAAYLPEPDLRFDGLILAGGGDMEPALYGAENCGSEGIDPARDRAELTLLEAFAAAGKPILGICRGHQVVNVWAGGGLRQDLGVQNAIHRREDCDKRHRIFAEPGVLHSLFGDEFVVNSAHHQSVEPVGRDLRVTARSEDGVVEAMEHTALPILTVQFHPERIPGLEPIFSWFLAECEEN